MVRSNINNDYVAESHYLVPSNCFAIVTTKNYTNFRVLYNMRTSTFLEQKTKLMPIQYITLVHHLISAMLISAEELPNVEPMIWPPVETV